MNIEITRHEADQLRTILADAMASAERMIMHPEVSVQLATRSETIAHVCLSVINKIVHQQQHTMADKARALLKERTTGERPGLDR